MQAAFLGFRVFPPPASGADILTIVYRAGAGGATDAGIAFVMQCVVRHIELFDVVPHILLGPIHQGIKFRHVVKIIPFLVLHAGAGHRLLMVYPRHRQTP